MSFPGTTDSALVARLHPSPNFGPRNNGSHADAIILHYTGMATAEAALATLCNPAREVSCHYFVTETGEVIQLVAEAARAWHAGASNWAGESDMNSRSLGIEIVNCGHDGGRAGAPMPAYPLPQIAGVIALCQDIMRRHAIAPARVLAHSDIAPGRKIDPGEAFPWGALHRAGVGHWVQPSPLRAGSVLTPGDSGGEVRALQQDLARYGYGLSVTGLFDAETRKVLRAFQLHFRPRRVDGIADASTRTTLRRLLAGRTD